MPRLYGDRITDAESAELIAKLGGAAGAAASAVCASRPGGRCFDRDHGSGDRWRPPLALNAWVTRGVRERKLLERIVEDSLGPGKRFGVRNGAASQPGQRGGRATKNAAVGITAAFEGRHAAPAETKTATMACAPWPRKV